MMRAVLFDMDGLMVDSESHALAMWAIVLARRGITLDQPAIDAMFGQRLDATSRMLVRRYGLADVPEKLGAEKTELQIERLDGNVQAMPGLRELVDELDRRSLRYAIASSGLRRYIEAVLRIIGLAERFNVIVSGDDVARGKPAPDVFLCAAGRLGVRPLSCLVLEDAPNGVAAAKAAGMTCIAVPNRHTRSLDLSAADRIMHSLHVVRDELDSLLNLLPR